MERGMKGSLNLKGDGTAAYRDTQYAAVLT
jgi:hypothetical protein